MKKIPGRIPHVLHAEGSPQFNFYDSPKGTLASCWSGQIELTGRLSALTPFLFFFLFLCTFVSRTTELKLKKKKKMSKNSTDKEKDSNTYRFSAGLVIINY